MSPPRVRVSQLDNALLTVATNYSPLLSNVESTNQQLPKRATPKKGKPKTTGAMQGHVRLGL